MSESKKLRVGVIGAGNAATQLHLPNLALHQRVELVGVASVPRPTARHIADWRERGCGMVQVWESPRDLIESPGVDAVVVASPNDTQYGYVSAALENGKHVLCEKPCGLSSGETTQMWDRVMATRQPHLVLHVNYIFRFLDGVRVLQRLIAEGYVGTVQSVSITSLNNAANELKIARTSWRHSLDRGGGVWLDMGSHFVDLATFLFGDAQVVSAELNNLQGVPVAEGETDYEAKATLDHDGIPVTIWVSQIYDGPTVEHNRQLVIVGDRGTLIQTLTRGNRLGDKPELLFRGHDGSERCFDLPTRPTHDPYAPRLAVDAFVSACLGTYWDARIGQIEPATLLDADQVHELLEAARHVASLRSAQDCGTTVRA